MPRYFFHVTDGYSIRDAEGTELPDIYAAQDQAIRTSGEILRDMGASSGTSSNGRWTSPTRTARSCSLSASRPKSGLIQALPRGVVPRGHPARPDEGSSG